MRYNFSLALVAIYSRVAFGMGDDHNDHDDHGHDHSHANAVEIDVVKDANYHMALTYIVESDKFGDMWLVFESNLEAETDESKYQDGWYVSQWFQIEEGSHHMHDDGHDHRLLEEEDHEYETV